MEETVQFEVEREQHFIRLPMTTSLGGKTSAIDLLVVFELEGETYFYKSITGSIGEASYSMNHLSQTHGVTLTHLIMNNKDNWDNDKIWYRPTSQLLAAVS